MSHTYGGPTWNKNTFRVSTSQPIDYELYLISINEKLNHMIELLKEIKKLCQE